MSTIFTKEISAIRFDDIEHFIGMKVREGLRLDYKEDFPKELPKLIAAFANSRGGIVLIGVKADKETNEPTEISGIELKDGLEERVISLALSNITPTIIPEVKVVKFKSISPSQQEDRAVVIIRVNESELAPHQTSNNDIWIRAYNECQKADLLTIETLFDKQVNSQKNLVIEEETLLEQAQKIVMDEFEVTKRPTYLHIRIVPAYHSKTIDFSKADDDFLTLQIKDFLDGQLPQVKPKLRSVEFRIAVKGATYDYFTINSKGSFLYVTPLPLEGDESKLNVEAITRLLFKAIIAVTKIYSKYSFNSKVALNLGLKGVRNRLLYVGKGLTSNNFKCVEEQINIDFEGSLESLQANNAKNLQEIYNKLLRAFGCSWDERIVQFDFFSAINSNKGSK